MATYYAALRDLQKGRLAPAYLLHGEEAFLRDEFIRLLAETFLGADGAYGREKVEGSACSLSDCLARLEGGNLFASRRLVVVSDAPYLAPPRGKQEGAGAEGDAGGEETLPEKAEADPAPLARFLDREGSRPVPESIVAFTVEKADRRRRLFKLLEQRGVAVECAPLKGEEMAGWIRQQAASLGKKMDRGALERLLLDSGDLWSLRREIEKFAAYLEEGEDTITAAVVDLLYSGDPRGNVFQLADALGEGNPALAFQRLQALLKRREPPLLIFFMIVRHYRLLLQARLLADAGVPQPRWAASLGVAPFVAGKLRRQISGYTREALEDALLALHQLDLQLKTGRLDPQAALEFAVNRLHELRT